MTYTTKHTPGPWVVRNMSDAMAEKFTVERLSDNGLRSVICRINDMEVCPEHGGTGSDANAALIAAAPAMYREIMDLLDTIRHMQHYYNGPRLSQHDLQDIISKGVGILAQAEGKQ